jgi:hypothetical protein
MTSAQIVDEIASRTKVSRRDIALVLTAFSDHVVEQAATGDRMQLTSLGRFERRIFKGGGGKKYAKLVFRSSPAVNARLREVGSGDENRKLRVRKETGGSSPGWSGLPLRGVRQSVERGVRGRSEATQGRD